MHISWLLQAGSMLTFSLAALLRSAFGLMQF